MFQKLWEYRMMGHHQALAPLRRLPAQPMTLSAHLERTALSEEPRCLYVHVPFCSKICTFCNMRRSNCKPSAHYADLVVRQIGQLGSVPALRNGAYAAVYFGGGTPTTLSSTDLTAILSALRDTFPLTRGCEITVESSLTELTEGKLEALRVGGVNRLSLGVQTFSDAGRRRLGRRGDGAHALARILKDGPRNANIDLIYNYPDQTPEDLSDDLAQILRLPLAGLSYYALHLSEGSALAKSLDQSGTDYARSTLEQEHEYWGRIYYTLVGAGFEPLELTKLVRPGRDEYRYIRIRNGGGDTLPLGAGAGGRLGRLSLQMPEDPAQYAALLDRPFESRYAGRLLDPAYEYLQRQIGKLQLGYLDAEGEAPASVDAAGAFEALCAFAAENGLGAVQAGRLTLSPTGIFWGNNLAHRYAELLAAQALQSKEAVS
ncbi:MAG TPA: radical SAM protein [Clostridia bacterium]|nr:radical SAM protein [Clostridia bacterium]